jgi:hypothetical protein
MHTKATQNHESVLRDRVKYSLTLRRWAIRWSYAQSRIPAAHAVYRNSAKRDILPSKWSPAKSEAVNDSSIPNISEPICNQYRLAADFQSTPSSHSHIYYLSPSALASCNSHANGRESMESTCANMRANGGIVCTLYSYAYVVLIY